MSTTSELIQAQAEIIKKLQDEAKEYDGFMGAGLAPTIEAHARALSILEGRPVPGGDY